MKLKLFCPKSFQEIHLKLMCTMMSFIEGILSFEETLQCLIILFIYLLHLRFHLLYPNIPILFLYLY